MDDLGYEPLVTLTTMGDLIAAHVLVAHLLSEGVTAVVRGEPLGPYPVTVGRMAVTEILVPQNELEEARVVLEEIELEASSVAVESAGVGKSTDLRVSVMWWLVAVGVLTLVVWARLARYL